MMAGMPRFVILLHELPAGHDRSTHYDLMLEKDGLLQTWACQGFPDKATEAQRLANHRLAYLEYEGLVSGDRGKVTRVEGGTCEWLRALADSVQVRLTGAKLAGTLTLTLDDEKAQRWRVAFEPA